MDVTYFGRQFGTMVFKDAHTGYSLYWKHIKHEAIKDYVDVIIYLKKHGWLIRGIVCDGKNGLFYAFEEPIQMCQFHQVAIVSSYITSKPKLEASKELKEILHLLSRTDK